MANVKVRYSEITREAKKEIAQAADASGDTPGDAAEARLMAKFRDRAREDFRTLSPTPAKRG